MVGGFISFWKLRILILFYRASTQNSQRSLPEIPHPVGRHDSGDTASEIYATVNIDEGIPMNDETVLISDHSSDF